MHLFTRSATPKWLGTLLLLLLGLTPAYASETLLHSFTNNHSSGAYPVGQLTLDGALLYGVTEYGINGYGSIFSMNTSGALTTLHEFAGGTGDGYRPNSGMVLASSNFYGTTIYGGASNAGVIYEITPGGTFSLLHSFTGYNSTTPASSDGAYPYAALTQASDKKLYGVTYNGGVNNQGTLFSINTDGSSYTLLHSFNYSAELIENPLTAVTEGPDGYLYGTSQSVSGYNGGVYKIAKDGTGIALVHGFSGSDPAGYSPDSDLLKAKDGYLYGTCSSGGADGFGTVYKLDTSTGTVSLLWAFDGETGADPGPAYSNYTQSRLIQGSDGNLYGVTQQGGYNGYGTLFKLTEAGVCTELSGFNYSDSDGTANPPVQYGTSFYLTSYYGGMTANIDSTNGYGAAIAVSTSGTLKVLQSFYMLDAYNPYAGLVLVGTGTSAAYYGVTDGGGEFSDGAIIKITAAGVFKILHHLDDSLHEGYSPMGALLLGRDNYLYGTTTGGGLYGYGTIFKISTSGVYTVIHNFQRDEGYYPVSALSQPATGDSDLYGACYYGGPSNGAGTVFKIATNGTGFRVLHYFAYGDTDGAYPTASPLPDGKGNLYGTCYQGGANNLGDVWILSTTGTTFKDLFDFYYNSKSGTYPAGYDPYYAGRLILNGDYLYGVAEYGGAHGNGTIFKTNTTTGATTAFHSFNNAGGEGYYPVGGLFYSSSAGDLYGCCLYGGKGGYGTVWKAVLSSGAFGLLHSFTGYNSTTPSASDGAYPYGGVILGADGTLWGTTLNGGTDNYGTIFKQTTSP